MCGTKVPYGTGTSLLRLSLLDAQDCQCHQAGSDRADNHQIAERSSFADAVRTHHIVVTGQETHERQQWQQHDRF
jgi:hypothetical protein